VLTQTDKANDLAVRFGGASGGEFAPAGTPISELAQEYGTPFYLYHGEMISERVSRVRETLETEVSYSVKANPSLGVCQLIASEREAGAEVASSGELAVALAAGFEPQDIVFAGPGKTDD
jgi:diaminopimelate decarboxylase